ncbi:alpha/beta fold hydrolase [Nocardioides montaniterrae]
MTEQLTIQVERDGLVFDVFDSGPRDGEPIVLLHGFPERSTCWGAVVPLLNAAGYRTLAMDQRGYSPRARPRGRKPYRVTELALDVVAMLDQVLGKNERAHVVGHDWGAVVGWTLASLHSERVVTYTAVSVPHPGAFAKAMVRSSQGLKSWYMAYFNIPGLPEYVTRRFPKVMDHQLRASGMTDEGVARFRREIVEDGALPTALSWYRALPLNDPRDAFTPAKVPTTFVWSSADVALGRWGAEHTEAYVDADYHFVALEGLSHWLPTEAPDVLADAILSRVGG